MLFSELKGVHLVPHVADNHQVFVANDPLPVERIVDIGIVARDSAHASTER
jgi:hypothetical protein